MSFIARKTGTSMRAIAAGIISLLLIPAWISPAFGQASVIPLMQEIEVNRGGKTRFSLQIANRGKDPLTFVMSAFDLAITEEGIPSPIYEPIERSCVDWITFTPETFELGPDEVKIVEGLVHAPKDAEGGYYAFIMSDFRVPLQPFMMGEEEKIQAQIDLGRAVSSVLLITTRSSKNTTSLVPDSLVLVSGQNLSSKSALELSPSQSSNVWRASLAVKNTGNVHALAKGEISIWTENARLIERADLTAGHGYVLPGKRRIFRAEGVKPLADGIYVVKVQIRTQNGRLMQNSFPYSILNGQPRPGIASEESRSLLKAFSPDFSLSRRLLDFQITPEGKRTKGIMLKNYSPDSLSVYPRIIGWTLDDNGKVVLRPDSRILVRSCESWLEVSPNPIRIDPRRSSAAKITVAAPPDMKGEYYAAIVFETEEPKQQLPTELEMPRTLIMTVSSAKDLEYKAEVESFRCKPVSPIMREFIVNTVNTGNVHCFSSGKLEIYDHERHLVFEPIKFGGTNEYILPGRIRGYAVPCPGALAPGSYEAVVLIEYKEGTPPAVSKLVFESGGK